MELINVPQYNQKEIKIVLKIKEIINNVVFREYLGKEIYKISGNVRIDKYYRRYLTTLKTKSYKRKKSLLSELQSFLLFDSEMNEMGVYERINSSIGLYFMMLYEKNLIPKIFLTKDYKQIIPVYTMNNNKTVFEVEYITIREPYITYLKSIDKDIYRQEFKNYKSSEVIDNAIEELEKIFYSVNNNNMEFDEYCEKKAEFLNNLDLKEYVDKLNEETKIKSMNRLIGKVQ